MANKNDYYKDRYKKIEVTFNTHNQCEMDLYYYLLQKSSYLGKSKFIKNLLREAQEKELLVSKQN